MGVEVRVLEWDSEFFELRVGRATGDLRSPKDLSAFEDRSLAADIQLVYYAAPEALPEVLLRQTTFEWLLADVKLTYLKPVDHIAVVADEVAVAERLNDDDRRKIEDLAIQSGVHSRFKVDPNIPDRHFEALYRLWIRKSLSGEMALTVLTARVGNSLAGFVTLGEKDGRGDIGIIAVDHHFRGRGLGRKLMQSAEQWFADHGYAEIQVVTQQRNIPARKLYEHCGFRIDHSECFYHVWQPESH